MLNGESKEVEFFSIETGKKINRPKYIVDWDITQAQKGNFDHFMMKEITEQVDSIKAAINQNKTTLFSVSSIIKKAKGIFLVACGSSYHVCLTASYLFSKIAHVHVNVVLGSEFSSYEHFLTDESLVEDFDFPWFLSGNVILSRFEENTLSNRLTSPA